MFLLLPQEFPYGDNKVVLYCIVCLMSSEGLVILSGTGTTMKSEDWMTAWCMKEAGLVGWVGRRGEGESSGGEGAGEERDSVDRSFVLTPA